MVVEGGVLAVTNFLRVVTSPGDGYLALALQIIAR